MAAKRRGKGKDLVIVPSQIVSVDKLLDDIRVKVVEDGGGKYGEMSLSECLRKFGLDGRWKFGEEKEGKEKSRTGRKTVYLGYRVPDTKAPGLDSLTEIERICKAILRDYRMGRIDARTANGRFARLHNTIIPRSKSLVGKKRKAKQIVEKYWRRL